MYMVLLLVIKTKLEDWGDKWITCRARKGDFSVLTSMETIKLEECAVRDGVTGGMEEAAVYRLARTLI